MGRLTESAETKTKAASFLHKIKTSTADLHLRLESQALLHAIMTPSVTSLQYCFYLTLMKEIEEVYEREIVTRLSGTLQAFEHRKASQLISDDLNQIGEALSESLVLKEYSLSCNKSSIPFALGFMYVMEGSKLGGKVIYKHIHRTLGYSENGGASFIADYGINTFGLWKEFLSNFSSYVLQNQCEEETIQGAEYAFSSIYDFFESNRIVYEL